MEWYKTLTLNQRFALRELCKSICGMNWEDFNSKLKLEGFLI